MGSLMKEHKNSDRLHVSHLKPCTVHSLYNTPHYNMNLDKMLPKLFTIKFYHMRDVINVIQ